LPEVTFLINGDGAARSTLESKALGLKNVRFAGYIEVHRLSELLATGDIHLVPLKAGLGRVSVPSKTYSILAAARPVVAAIDKATAVPRILESASAGISIPPDDAEALIAALRLLLANPDWCAQMGASGRRWVETHASPAVVGLAYDGLLRQLRAP
jgi:colanic acid biosynthesis glycosyl transferase WcaI